MAGRKMEIRCGRKGKRSGKVKAREGDGGSTEPVGSGYVYQEEAKVVNILSHCHLHSSPPR